MKLSKLIDDIILDEQLQGNVDKETLEALLEIKKLTTVHNIHYRKEHVTKL